MPVFIDCFLDQKYERLIISGEATPEQLGDRWLRIQSEFYELSGSSGVDSLLAQLWERDTLRSRTANIHSLLAKLAKVPDDETLRECLALRGYSFSGDQSLFESEIRRAQGMLKGEQYKLKELLGLLESMKQGTDTKRLDFTKQLMEVSKFEGYRLKIDDLTVAEYCLHVARLREHNEHLEKQMSDANAD